MCVCCVRLSNRSRARCVLHKQDTHIIHNVFYVCRGKIISMFAVYTSVFYQLLVAHTRCTYSQVCRIHTALEELGIQWNCECTCQREFFGPFQTMLADAQQHRARLLFIPFYFLLFIGIKILNGRHSHDLIYVFKHT